MRSVTKEVVLISASDLHFSHTPPRYRSNEPDWYEAMARPVVQLQKLVDKYKCPVVYPGDLFEDGWRQHKCPPELINFVADILPYGYAVPGQHDLPHHRYDDVKKSAYHTLVKMAAIEDLPPGVPIPVNKSWEKPNLWLHGFPWGHRVLPPEEEKEGQGYGDDAIKVAVVHAMCWWKSYKHEGASSEEYAGRWITQLVGYDVALFGDNHKGFAIQKTKTTAAIVNNGTFMVRHKDDRAYTPKVGLVYDDGTVGQLALDTAEDHYADDDEVIPKGELAFDVDEFVKELEKGTTGKMIDFIHQLRARARRPDVSEAIRDLLLKVMEQS